jgi:hypothetical protein
LPFQVGSVLLAVVLGWAGLATQPWLAALLAVALWAPAAAEVLLRTTIPWALQLHYILFMIGGPFAGSALNLYGALPVWDGLIHFDSGVMLAWLGMLLVRRAEESANAPLPHWFSLTVILFTPMAFAPVVLIVPVVAVIGAVAVVRLTALAPLVVIAEPAAAFSVCAWSPVTVTPGTPTVGVMTVSEFNTTVSGAAAT